MSFLWVDIFLTTLVTENDTDLLKIPSFLLRLLQYTVPSAFFGVTKYSFFLSFCRQNFAKSQQILKEQWLKISQKSLTSEASFV